MESVQIGICQNWNSSELKYVRIGICQNWNLLEFEIVRIGNLSELEFVRIRLCHSLRVSAILTSLLRRYKLLYTLTYIQTTSVIDN